MVVKAVSCFFLVFLDGGGVGFEAMAGESPRAVVQSQLSIALFGSAVTCCNYM